MVLTTYLPRIAAFLLDMLTYVTTPVESIFLRFSRYFPTPDAAGISFLAIISLLHFICGSCINRLGRKRRNGHLLLSSPGWQAIHFILGFATSIIHFAAYYVILTGDYLSFNHNERCVAWGVFILMAIFGLGNATVDRPFGS